MTELILSIIFILMVITYFFAALYLVSGLKYLSKQISTYFPSVSIIVSMHNEEKNVKECLNSLLRQDYPGNNFEIIIVNDRSTDKTAEYLNKFSDNNKNIHILTINDIQKDIAPKKNAIDTAIRTKAKGEIILLTDADGRPGPFWIQSMISYFTKETGMVLGYAPYKTEPPYSSFLKRLYALEYFSHAAITITTLAHNYPVSCVGTNMAYRKEVYLQLDGFGKYKNYPSGDDDLFMQRVRDETNWNIRYAANPESHVFNTPPENWKKFYHQRLRYASKGFFYPASIITLISVYLIFNILFLLLPFLSFFHNFSPILLISGLLLKMVSEFLFFYKAAITIHDQRNLILLPLFSILHIPYVVYFAVAAQIQSFEWAGIQKK